MNYSRLSPKDDIVDIFINVHCFTPLGRFQIVTVKQHKQVRGKLTPSLELTLSLSPSWRKVACLNSFVNFILNSGCQLIEELYFIFNWKGFHFLSTHENYKPPQIYENYMTIY